MRESEIGPLCRAMGIEGVETLNDVIVKTAEMLGQRETVVNVLRGAARSLAEGEEMSHDELVEQRFARMALRAGRLTW